MALPRRILTAGVVLAGLVIPAAAWSALPLPVVDPTTPAARDAEPVILTGQDFKDWAVLPDGSKLAQGEYPGNDGRIYRSVPLGMGMVDLKGALAKLRAMNYQGAISVEYEGSSDPRAAVEESLSYVRSLFTAAGVA